MSNACRLTRRKGFTLIEALASVALLSLGVIAVMGALKSLSGAEDKALRLQHMEELAHQKYNELIALDEIGAGSVTGDFEEQNESRYGWSLEVGVTGIENLSALELTVEEANTQAPLSVTVSGLLYTPPPQGVNQ